MKILHITPHLGGGVGKAHSAILAEGSAGFDHHYLLLETPRDWRFADLVQRAGGTVEVMRDRSHAEALMTSADIVQIEWWNHPRLYELLSQPLPAMRRIFWVHISGLFAPYYPIGLVESADRFVFTSPCSLTWSGLERLPEEVRRRLAVVGSGFGYDAPEPLPPASQRRDIAYLGTVDFVKMHPDFFAMIDSVARNNLKISLYGTFDSDGEPARAWRGMNYPERVSFEGQTSDPRPILERCSIFFYPLRPDHYGTAENALIEAMSVGAVPLVMGNPAETAIVRDGENGVVANDLYDVAVKLAAMIDDPASLDRMSQRAIADAAAFHHPARSMRIFEGLYRDLIDCPKGTADLGAILGRTPRDWFLSTQYADRQDRAPGRFSRTGSLSKGSLDHFLAAFPEDEGLLALAS